MTERQQDRIIPLGLDLRSKEIYQLSLASLMKTHTRVMGATGSGKSRLLLHLTRSIIAEGFPLILIDGKGDLVDSVERDLAATEYPAYIGPNRVAIIDPADTHTFAPGFNPLALDGREPYSRAHSVLEAMKKVFGEEDEAKPWLSEVMLNSFVPLERAGFGILELATFLQNDRFRETILAKHSDHWLDQYWRYIENELPPAEKVARLSAALTRASLLWSSGEGIRRIFGQLEDSLDWPKILSPGGILLVNANGSRGVDEKAANFLGTIVLQKLIEIAQQRPKHNRVPTFIIIDELALFASKDVVRGLELLRGYGVHLILAHQFLEQLEEVPGLLGAVESCAQNRIVFSTSFPDAERLQGELFTGYLPERKVIQEIYSIYFAPEQRWMDVESVTYSPEVTSETQSESSSSSEDGRSDSYGPGLSIKGSHVGRTTSLGTSSASTTSTTSTTPAYETTTCSRQLITEYEQREQLSSRQLEGLEELKEHGREALMRQPQQHCIVQLQHGPPVPIRVADIHDAPVSDQTLELYKKLIYRTYPTGEQVDRELKHRVERFLAKEIPTYGTTTKTTTIRIPKKTKPSAPSTKRRRSRHPKPSDH